MQGELQSKADQAKKYRGVLHGIKVILQNEGPRGLFRGIGTAVCDMAICDGANLEKRKADEKAHISTSTKSSSTAAG